MKRKKILFVLASVFLLAACGTTTSTTTTSITTATTSTTTSSSKTTTSSSATTVTTVSVNTGENFTTAELDQGLSVINDVTKAGVCEDADKLLCGMDVEIFRVAADGINDKDAIGYNVWYDTAYGEGENTKYPVCAGDKTQAFGSSCASGKYTYSYKKPDPEVPTIDSYPGIPTFAVNADGRIIYASVVGIGHGFPLDPDQSYFADGHVSYTSNPALYSPNSWAPWDQTNANGWWRWEVVIPPGGMLVADNSGFAKLLNVLGYPHFNENYDLLLEQVIPSSNTDYRYTSRNALWVYYSTAFANRGHFFDSLRVVVEDGDIVVYKKANPLYEFRNLERQKTVLLYTGTINVMRDTSIAVSSLDEYLAFLTTQKALETALKKLNVARVINETELYHKLSAEAVALAVESQAAWDALIQVAFPDMFI